MTMRIRGKRMKVRGTCNSTIDINNDNGNVNTAVSHQLFTSPRCVLV